MIEKTRGFKRGGVHPHDEKALSSQQAIVPLQPKETITIPLIQHIGSPPKRVVEVGSVVEAGALLAESSGFVSAPVHTPLAGEVQSIQSIMLPTGIRSEAITIKLDPQKVPFQPIFQDWKRLEKDQILKQIADAGIVGSGGATFPTHVKLTIPKGKEVHWLIINGVECEPYLNCDNRLMLEQAKQIIEGIAIIQRVVEAKEILIGIEKNKPEAILAMEQASQEAQFPLKVIPLKVRYPQGDEKQLIEAITKKEIPSKALPIDIKAVVINVASAFSIYEAIVCQKPFLDRVVTVSGRGIQHPANFRVPIGTPFSTLVEAAGGFMEKTIQWVTGGPMMGFAFYDLENSFVTKGTGGILALTAEELHLGTTTACLNCGRCLRVCPMGLHPTKMFRAFEARQFERLLSLGLMDCKECGCCGYACPAHIPLIQGFKIAKREVKKRT